MTSMTKFEISDAMFEAAIEAWFRVVKGAESNFLNGTPNPPVPPENLHDAMRAAITAAIEASGILELIAKAAAVLDHADAHCRAFPIATAPADGTTIMVWDGSESAPCWETAYYSEARAVFINDGGYELTIEDLTHWRPLPPPPSNPPLPAVFTELGQALEKIKGAT
jgi:hypothetical protein